MIHPRGLASSALAGAGLAFLAACAPARSARPPARPQAEATSGWIRRAFEVEQHGRLVLSIPPGWSVSEGEEGEASVPAIRLEDAPHSFKVLLTPLWNPGVPEDADARADTAQLFADIARRNALAGSVERDIPLEELSAPGVKGFWFAATDRELVDREPGPEEWRHVLQGAAAVGPIILTFTLLDNGPGPHRTQVLELVRTARHLASGGEGPR